MTATDVILIAQAIASAAMCGIIWFVQLSHYPSFDLVGDDGRAFARENQRRTASVVVPFMLVEAVTAALLAWSPPAGEPGMQRHLHERRRERGARHEGEAGDGREPGHARGR